MKLNSGDDITVRKVLNTSDDLKRLVTQRDLIKKQRMAITDSLKSHNPKTRKLAGRSKMSQLKATGRSHQRKTGRKSSNSTFGEEE